MCEIFLVYFIFVCSEKLLNKMDESLFFTLASFRIPNPILILRSELTGLPGKEVEFGCAAKTSYHVTTLFPFIAIIHSLYTFPTPPLINFRILHWAPFKLSF